MVIHRVVGVVLSFGLLVGCDGSGGGRSPTAPSSSSQLTINVTSDVIRCGKCESFTATLTRNGVTQNVTPTWRTDNTAIATIDAAGQLTAITHGEVTVIAEHQGLSASKRVRIVADYEAAWHGNYLITRCDARFDFEGFCDSDMFGPGQTLPIALELTQDRERVSGTLWLGQLDGPFTGSVATSGNLEGEAKFTYTAEEGSLDLLVSPFTVLREGDRISSGTFTVTMTSPGYRGNCTFDARIMGLDKAPAAGTSAPMQQRLRTIRDVVRLIRR